MSSAVMRLMPSWYTSPATTRDAEGDGGDDGRLGGGVEALDVGGGVTLGVPEPLRLGEGGAVVGPLLGHLGEDVVRRAVDDAHDAVDGLAPQALAQHPHDGDAAGHGRFEQEVPVGGGGGGEQLGADVGQQLLVGGDDGLAGGEGGEDQLTGGLDAADHLDHDVDVGIRHHGGAVTGEHAFGQLDVALAGEVAHGHGGDLQAQPGAGLDGVGLLGHETDQGGTDVAAPEHPDSHHVRHARPR